jgi:hypothetical protein
MPELRKLIDQIRETQRYVKSDSMFARSCIDAHVRDLRDLPGYAPRFDRLTENLRIASKYIQVEPDVACAYLHATAFELEILESHQQ